MDLTWNPTANASTMIGRDSHTYTPTPCAQRDSNEGRGGENHIPSRQSTVCSPSSHVVRRLFPNRGGCTSFPPPPPAPLKSPPSPSRAGTVSSAQLVLRSCEQSAKGTCRAATPRKVSSCDWKRTKEPEGGRLLTLRSSTCPPSDKSKFCIIQYGKNTWCVGRGVQFGDVVAPSLYRSRLER